MSFEKLTLRISLQEPLPQRNFMFVCKQTTVKELRNEIRRRILPITKQPIVLVLGGFELMDDDLVTDILTPDDFICVHKAGIDGAPVVVTKADRSVVVSKKVHGGEGHTGAGLKAHKKKRMAAEMAYEDAGKNDEADENSESPDKAGVRSESPDKISVHSELSDKASSEA
ncbi:hypothetical protein LPJ53_005008 [Coemansia erecta]|uniref:Ubiquitin-like domain-containing protein n=1 Tax=Coemansia erecta TaxID=147472 RepID=A0A9W7XXN1_9FUNG|nr:hypothetical protein LPJ53_005008 [Coemansia erecta]